jgi:multimeric flavodoxin WrbA
MKVVAFNGSPRKDGNTGILIDYVLKELDREGIQTERVDLADKSIQGCMECYGCIENKDGHCANDQDDLNQMIDKMVEADGMILASPTFFTDVSTEMKALIDRAGFVAWTKGGMFKRKIGAAVVASRRAGSTHVFDTMNHFFLISEMIVPGSNYWNVGMGLKKGEVEKDEEGIQTMKVLGQNMAWLMKKLCV